MSPSAIKARTCHAVSRLLQVVKGATEEEWRRRPASGAWSLAQVCDHLIGSSRDLHLANARACLDRRGTGKGRKRFGAWLLLALGRFPRIKLPMSQAMPLPRDISREEALVGLEKVLEQAEDVCLGLRSADPSVKVSHPDLGALDAWEWAVLLPMHLEHHLDVQLRHR